MKNTNTGNKIHIRAPGRSPYFWTILFFVATPIVSTGFTPELLNSNLSTHSALTLHIFMSAFMLLGYLIVKIYPPKKARVNYPLRAPKVSRSYLIASICLSLVGLAAVIHSATYNSGIEGYLTAFVEGDNQLREDFEASSASGGAPGYIKIFSYAPLAVFLNIASLIYVFGSTSLQDKRLKSALVVSVICLVFKIVFALDRLTIAAIGMFIVALGLKRLNLSSFVFAVLTLAFADYISRLRLTDFGLFDFLILYANLGLQNFELLIDSNTKISFGFETFLHPLLLIFRFIGFPLDLTNKNYEWVWNPAQYFFGYLYLDLSLASIPFCFFIGSLLGYIDTKSQAGVGRTYSIYFVVLYCIISFLGVPALRGVEFWFTLTITYTLSRLVKICMVEPRQI